jgi:hypothetical protein
LVIKGSLEESLLLKTKITLGILQKYRIGYKADGIALRPLPQRYQTTMSTGDKNMKRIWAGIPEGSSILETESGLWMQ